MADRNLRQLEVPGQLYINKWWTGQVDNRSPLFTPISAMGLQIITRLDALWDGLNFEISPKMTLWRRYGFSRFDSVQFGASSWPLSFYSFKNLAGTIKPMVDTPTNLYTFTSGALTSVFSKSSTAQGSMAKVKNMLYFCDGNDSDTKKWDGTTATKWGIATPVVAPTLSFGAGALSPTSGYLYGYCYRNSSTGHVSTMSPTSANTNAQTSKNITVGYTASSDGQVDKIWIFRTNDGGSNYYFLAEVANGTSTYTDSTADSGLNNDIVAPTAHQNDPPPSGISLTIWHMGRLWVVSGNVIYFSGGPDTTTGVGSEAFPPANNFQVPGAITALASTTNGLVVFTSDNAWVTLGQDATSFTVPQLWQKNFGVASQNSVVQDGDVLFVFTSKGQLFQVSNTLTEIGNPIATHLAAFTPANVYLALHRSGADEGLFVSDGASNIWRYSMAMGAWSPVAQPVGGCKCVGSIETSTNNWTLLMGRTAGSGYILARDTSTFTDDGSTYTGFVTVGSLIVAPARKVEVMNCVTIDAMPVGTYPTVAVLLNEISGTFTTLPNPVNDPPQLVGSSSVLMKRHDLKAAQTPLPQHVRHLQIKISIPAEAAHNELLAVGIA